MLLSFPFPLFIERDEIFGFLLSTSKKKNDSSSPQHSRMWRRELARCSSVQPGTGRLEVQPKTVKMIPIASLLGTGYHLGHPKTTGRGLSAVHRSHEGDD